MFDLDRIRVRLDGTGWRPLPPVGPARAVVWADRQTGLTTLVRDGQVKRRWPDPLQALGWLSAHVRQSAPPGDRWIGFLSYELGRWCEQMPPPRAAGVDVPLMVFTLHSPSDRPAELQPAGTPRPTSARADFARAAYESAVARAIEYVRAGDVFQVNLSQRFTVDTAEHPWALYARLTRAAPAPYAACLDYGPFGLVSNSPELFLRVEPGGRVVTRPIKGTRPNRPGMAEQLRASEKDAAELNMIVDLERNDLGRVCRIGSVRVTESRTIERYPTVVHGVATVQGQLSQVGGAWATPLFRSTFPGGSITGAPKVRAMQIIHELEPVHRGPYCGAIGYLAADGSAEFNVAIRTATLKDGTAHVSVGGGVVADSDPAAEYDETLVKAAAMFSALGVGPPGDVSPGRPTMPAE